MDSINNDISIKRIGLWRFELFAEQYISCSIKEVFNFYSEAKNLNLITPPFLDFNIFSQSSSINESTIFQYRLKIHGIPVKWKSLIKEWSPPNKFVDIQLSGPFIKWHHVHLFSSLGDKTKITDKVEYIVPGGALIHNLFVKRDLLNIFNYRKRALNKFFSSLE
tara:strand:+ start:1600 stop:2091 length:492 start_codon:yes stop_codon:yes gene_type:complete